MSRAHSIWTTKWEKKEQGGEQWMKKWQEDVGRLIVSRSGPFDLGRVRSQGLRPPRAHSWQGNCAVILTLHCLNFALRSLDPSLFLYLSLSLVEAEEKLGSALCSNDVSSPEEASVCWISTASLQSPRLDQGLAGGPGGWWRRINYTQ